MMNYSREVIDYSEAFIAFSTQIIDAIDLKENNNPPK
jgi:hypothetical protein